MGPLLVPHTRPYKDFMDFSTARGITRSGHVAALLFRPSFSHAARVRQRIQTYRVHGTPRLHVGCCVAIDEFSHIPCRFFFFLSFFVSLFREFR